MLIEGFQKSFRELNLVLKIQMDDRHRLGSEHPIWEKPLLDQEPDKLSYLCKKLNVGEEAERTSKRPHPPSSSLLLFQNTKIIFRFLFLKDNYKAVYMTYHDLANYFLLTDDIWLSDYFFEKCLAIALNQFSTSDVKTLAEAYCNLGLAYERQSNFFELFFL